MGMSAIKAAWAKFWAWPWKAKAPIMAAVAIVALALIPTSDDEPGVAQAQPDATEAASATAGPSETPKPTATPAPTVVSRCVEVPAALIEAIASGLETGGEASLRNVFAVRSNDYSEVYFVAGDIQGPGLDGDDEIGIWATNSLEGRGLILAADGFAQQFSVWPDADKTDAEISWTDDGGREAKDCAAG
jgi:hypothetical protein